MYYEVHWHNDIDLDTIPNCCHAFTKNAYFFNGKFKVKSQNSINNKSLDNM